MTKRRQSTGQTIGSILAGFDQQVFRATKPAAELVESAKPLPSIAGRDGSMLSIAFPEPAAGEDEGEAASGSGRAAEDENHHAAAAPDVVDASRPVMADPDAIE